MPDIITTWTVTFRRTLEADEDPYAAEALGQEYLLWALDEGEVSTTVDVIDR